MMKRVMAAVSPSPGHGGFLEGDVLPRVGVSAGDRGEDILPLGGRDPRAERVDESMAEDRDEIVLLEDRPLDVLSQFLAFGAVIRGEVFLEFVVECGDAEEILRVKAAAFEHRIVPVRPAATDARGVEDDLDP